MDHYYHPHQHYNPSTIPNLVSKIHFQTLYIFSCIEKHKCNHDIELWGRSMFMPQPHQNLYLVPTVTLLGIMLRNRWWPTTFHTITAGNADGWCLNWLVWSSPHKMLDPKTIGYILVWHKMNIFWEKKHWHMLYPHWLEKNHDQFNVEIKPSAPKVLNHIGHNTRR